MCNPKQHKMGMNFSYNMNSHFFLILAWKLWQKLKSQQHGSPHLLMWYSTTYGMQELLLIGVYWHKCCVVENQAKIDPMHTTFYAPKKPSKNFMA